MLAVPPNVELCNMTAIQLGLISAHRTADVALLTYIMPEVGL
jgi:hypothetical protein